MQHIQIRMQSKIRVTDNVSTIEGSCTRSLSEFFLYIINRNYEFIIYSYIKRACVKHSAASRKEFLKSFKTGESYVSLVRMSRTLFRTTRVYLKNVWEEKWSGVESQNKEPHLTFMFKANNWILEPVNRFWHVLKQFAQKVFFMPIKYKIELPTTTGTVNKGRGPRHCWQLLPFLLFRFCIKYI